MNKYTYLEVCAGCGGLSYGLECGGLNPIALYDIDKNCVKTLRRNFTCENIIEEDIRKVDFRNYKDKINLLVGGIPCNPYSTSGKRKGLNDEKTGDLFYEYLRVLDETEPDMFMIENVEGLLSINNGSTLKEMTNSLEERNYTISYKVLDARYFNVPQKRRRLIIVGTTLGIPFTFPKEHKQILTLRDALQNVPISDGIKYSERKKEL